MIIDYYTGHSGHTINDEVLRGQEVAQLYGV